MLEKASHHRHRPLGLHAENSLSEAGSRRRTEQSRPLERRFGVRQPFEALLHDVAKHERARSIVSGVIA